MTLVLEVEYLSGVSFAAVAPDSPIPDWPPQPDRIFSALVAAWAARGQDRQEAAALEWLERQPVPRILAPDAEPRTCPDVFVPPNDPRSDRKKTAGDVLPSLRRRKARRFPATRPHDAIVRLFWDGVAPPAEALGILKRLASDVACIGHSTSLTRCRFRLDHDARGPGDARPPARRIYPGRLAELRRTFDAGRRPLPGARVAPVPAAAPAPALTPALAPELERGGCFSQRWLILEPVKGTMPDLRACALVARTLRDTLLSGYRRFAADHAIPAIVSGHTPDGQPARTAHLAVVPLPFAGFPHADGHVMGFALMPPRDSAILDDVTFRRVLRQCAPIDEDLGRRVLTLTTKRGATADGAFSIGLSPTFEPPAGKRSLDPALYTRPARTFATVTPILLDRHLKKNGAARQEEIATQIATACRNIGLPPPEAIVGDKHSAIEGVPSAWPSGKSPPWMRWRLPPSQASRQLTHAVIRFARPMEGPVIPGAGRFVGLGLCRPLDPEAR